MNRHNRPQGRRLDSSFIIILGLLALSTTLAGVTGGTAGLVDGVENAVRLLLRALPFMLLGLGLAGVLHTLMSPDTVGKWMGDEAGWLGIGVGVLVGMVMPGGPYIVYPIAAAIMQGGAGLAAISGLLVARNVLGVERLLIWELPILGAPFGYARFLISLPLPILGMLLIPLLHRLLPSSMSGPAPATTRGRRRR